MIHQFSHKQLCAQAALRRTMHEDRKRVFVDTLNWDLPCDGQEERDQFDGEQATYLVLQDDQGAHRCSVRLLDTNGPHILGDIFHQLCDGPVPRGPDVKEITRYLASPRVRAVERLHARNMMARALIEYGLNQGISRYTAVCDLAFLNQILAAGWHCDPLGLPQVVGGAIVGAFCIHVEPGAIAAMTRSWRYDHKALAAASDLRLVA